MLFPAWGVRAHGEEGPRVPTEVELGEHRTPFVQETVTAHLLSAKHPAPCGVVNQSEMGLLSRSSSLVGGKAERQVRRVSVQRPAGGPPPTRGAERAPQGSAGPILVLG